MITAALSRKSRIIAFAAGLLSSFCFVSLASADPFDLPEEESYGSEQSGDSSSGILGGIAPNGLGGQQLYQAHGTTAPEAEKKDGWREFEDISGTKYEKTYLNSPELKMQRVLDKPLPQRAPVGGTLDDLEEAINSLHTPGSSGISKDTK